MPYSNLNNNVTYRLMKGRLGIYEKEPFDAGKSAVDGVLSQQTRLHQLGGNQQQERMIRNKRRSLDHAVWFSYQAAQVVKAGLEDLSPARALINPNKLKQDYDDKIISIGYEHGFEPGTVFQWLNTGTYWLVYLQDLTELAYFRGDIRKCSYQIAWEDEEGNLHSTYAAVRGPVETDVPFIQKHGISVDSPNMSLNILMPKNEDTLKYFKRYNKFYLQDNDVCWRVESIDWISMPGILEVNAVEYYSNEIEDDIAAGIVGGLIEEIKDPNVEEPLLIEGDTFIKVKMPSTYYFTGDEVSEWRVNGDYPVKLEVDRQDPKKVLLTWSAGYSGQFILSYGQYEKTIVAESLF